MFNAFETASDLGLKITRAAEGSEMFEAWSDRVAQVWASLEDGKIAEYYAARDDADAYAI
jgi:head-tail adaptor